MAHQVLKLLQQEETTIVWCHKNSQIYFDKYLLLVTFETNDNYLIRFQISNNSSTIRFDLIRNGKKNSIDTALLLMFVPADGTNSLAVIKKFLYVWYLSIL